MRPASADGTAVAGTDGAGETAPAGATFADPLAGLHRRFDAARFDDIYVVGDVHGCIDELRDLLDPLDVDSDDLVVFVGDLVRKGPDSEAVLELVGASPNMVSVRGNNEQKFIDGEEPPERLGDGIDRVASMPAAVSFDEALVVHGGVDPRRPLAEHALVDLLETRAIPPENGYEGPFWFELHEGPPRVFFGHTVLEAPLDREWAVGLDTGCVYGGELTAYDYRAGEFVSVPARETYRHRDSDSIVDPPGR
ncbi:metallophosphoesterase family protein [Natronomonas marina]|jgi:serine/threonine protein phosphatase 1|uniref:metallophosphoesterase family protein n=1 Tax=Natronomonas marina TaxID=2961939 RepID=UPI0020C9B201|nr:metallophosphoesterase family protein [Natronomonas marina]